MRRILRLPVSDLPEWQDQLVHWAAAQAHALLLCSNGSRDAFSTSPYEVLVGAGAFRLLVTPAGNAFEQLKALRDTTADWLFGGLAYDLKNEIEQLQSKHPDGIEFPDLCFFQPETVISVSNGLLEIACLEQDPQRVWDAIVRQKPDAGVPHPAVDLRARMPRADYLATVEAIRQHIVAGDLYEMNMCQEFFAEEVRIDPVAVWKKLNGLTAAPMSGFFRWNDRYLLSASPERFLRKEGNVLRSQPIKGTRRRAGEQDDLMRASLAASEKDRAENVMIVDLVRNDLARSCVPGTVRVDELFGIYTFKTVHQMISTVSGQLRADADAIDALKAAFPPGSMTGAPKVMAMSLIEQYERSRRGLYAGALGYLDPSGDFDFNVVIRSIFYHQSRGYVAAQVGGAIVYDSVPEAEYDECLVKAAALFEALR